jgi:hypothetical protein
MDEQFGHQKAIDLLREVRQLFEKKAIYQKRDRPIVFLCGGPIVPRARNMRRQFLAWAKETLPQLVIVLAEDAYEHTRFDDPLALINLADFETFITQVADCVLLFPESAGSFAELGLFSGNAKIKKKVIVANGFNFQTTNSFVNLGPIRTINQVVPTILVTRLEGRFDFAPLKNRLDELIDRRRKSFEYVTYEKLGMLQKVLVVLELIKIFQVLSLEGLYQCMRHVFDKARPKELMRFLAILKSAGYVRFEDGFYFFGPRRESLLEFDGVHIEDMQARVLFYYKAHRMPLYTRFERSLNAS